MLTDAIPIAQMVITIVIGHQARLNNCSAPDRNKLPIEIVQRHGRLVLHRSGTDSPAMGGTLIGMATALDASRRDP